jgi:hypothetical protein
MVNTFRACVALLLLAGCAAVPPGTLRDSDHPLAGRLWDVATQSFIDEAELLRRAGPPRCSCCWAKPTTTGTPSPAAAGAAGAPRRRRPAGAADGTVRCRPASRAGRSAPRRQGSGAADARLGLAAVPAAGGAGRHGPAALQAANLPRNAMRPVVREGFASWPPANCNASRSKQPGTMNGKAYMTEVIEASHCGMVTPATARRTGARPAPARCDAGRCGTGQARPGRGVHPRPRPCPARCRRADLPESPPPRHARAVDRLRGSRRRQDGAGTVRDRGAPATSRPTTSSGSRRAPNGPIPAWRFANKTGAAKGAR